MLVHINDILRVSLDSTNPANLQEREEDFSLDTFWHQDIFQVLGPKSFCSFWDFSSLGPTRLTADMIGGFQYLHRMTDCKPWEV